MAHKSDEERIEQTRNAPRFFVEHPQVSWVLLIGVLVWGWFGYKSMPQRKDPNIPVRVAVASCSWPGATAQQVEQLVTRPIEDTVAQNKWIHAGTSADYGVRSISLPGYSYIYIQLVDNVDDLKRQFSDINLKLNALNSQLPQGAGPITFQSDFGDTAALMLTVASPKADSVEIDLRSQSIQAAIRSARANKKPAPSAKRVTIIYPFPESISPRAVAGGAALFERKAIRAGVLSNTTQILGTGFIGLDGTSKQDDASIQAFIEQFFANQVQRSELHPDAWSTIIIHDPADTLKKLSAVAGDKYSYAELDDFSDLIARTLQGAPETSKVERRGVQQQTIYLEFSQDRLAAYGLQPADLGKLIQGRNIIAPGGVFETGQRQITLNPSGQFESPKAIGNIVVTTATAGSPVYLRDLVDISRAYHSPANYLKY
jgi:multidrug efflux pump subunit AcrB